MQQRAEDLPPGKPSQWLSPIEAGSRPVGPHSVRKFLSRLWRLRRPRKLWEAIKRRLPPEAVTWIVSGKHAARIAKRERLKAQIEQLKDAVEQAETAKTTSADMVTNFLMTFLFDAKAETPTRESVSCALANQTPLQDIARFVAIQHFDKQSAPSFAEARPMLQKPTPFPKLDGLPAAPERFKIIDVGAEPLAFERSIYADLIDRWPALILGFDPFADDRDEPKENRIDTVGQREFRTVKTLIGDGGDAVFHVNRMGPTSSLLPSNTGFAGQFSLLGEALETIEKQPVTTERLDDVIAQDRDFAGAVDFLKIDVQGGSLTVLEGAEDLLKRTLVCQVEAEFSPIYHSEALFDEIDRHLRSLGFVLLDFLQLGRQRYKAFDGAPTYFFHAGRMLWADCIYVRSLDALENLDASERLRLAIMMHDIYQKKDVAAQALKAYDAESGTELLADYVNVADC